MGQYDRDRNSAFHRARSMGRRSIVPATGFAIACWVVALAAAAADEPTPPSQQQATPATHEQPDGNQQTGGKRLSKLSLEDLMNVEVATVTTASKRPERATDAPATAIVISAQDIRMRGYADLKDVLRDLPGMETTESYFSEIGTLVPVRGIVGNNKIVVLVNGMRVNPPGGEYFPFRSDFSVRDAEQVEVIYGPGSTLYGQDAISAVINVKTKKPVEGQYGEIGADGGLYSEHDAWFSFAHALGEGDNKINLTAHLQYHDSNLTHFDKDYGRWWSDFRTMAAAAGGQGWTPHREDFGINGFGRIEWRGWSLQVWHRESERNSGEGYGSGLPFFVSTPPPPKTVTVPGLGYLPQALWRDRSTVAELRNTFAISETLTLDSAVTYNRYQIDPSSRYVFTRTDPDGNTRWFFDDYKYGTGTSRSIEETLRWQITPELSLLAGVYAGDFDIIPKSTVPGGAEPNNDVRAQGGNFEYIDPSTGKLVRIPRVVETRYQTYAGYVEATWQATPKLKLIGGVRATGDTRISEIPVTPRASAIYNFTDALTGKYIYTQAFVAPAPYFANATYDNGTLLATSNPDLKPEKAHSHEINLTYARKNFSLGFSAYYGQQSNLIIVSDRNSTQNLVLPSVTEIDEHTGLPIGTRTLVHTVNGGKSHNAGFDLYGRATFGQISPWASYSYVDFQESSNGVLTGLQGISRHNLRLGATWSPLRHLFITPSLVLRSTPEHVANSGALGHLLNTPYEVNLHVEYELADRVQVFADLRNITNHKYALGSVAGGAIPQETFHGVLGLRVGF